MMEMFGSSLAAEPGLMVSPRSEYGRREELELAWSAAIGVQSKAIDARCRDPSHASSPLKLVMQATPINEWRA